MMETNNDLKETNMPGSGNSIMNGNGNPAAQSLQESEVLPFTNNGNDNDNDTDTDNDKKTCIEEEETKSGKEQTINPPTIAVAVTKDTNPAEADEKEGAVQPNSGCCSLFRHELSLSFFETYNEHELDREGSMSERTDDLEGQEDNDQINEEDKENRQKKILLLQQKYGEMFNTGTTNFKGVIIPKSIFLLLTIMTIIWSWIIARTPSFFLAYWSHWIVIYALVYQCLSLGLSLSRQDRPPPEWIFKFTWFMFSNTGTDKIIMMIMVWVLGFYDPDGFSFSYYMVHGGVAVLLMIQGFFIDRVPVRLRHYPAIAVLGLLFVAWTITHSFTLYENPDTESYDGGVYSTTLWKDDYVEPTIYTIGLIFVIGPFSFLMLWVVSVAIVRSGRRERLFAFFAKFVAYGRGEQDNDDGHAYDGTKKKKVVESRQESSMMDMTVAASDLEFSFKKQRQSIGGNDSVGMVVNV